MKVLKKECFLTSLGFPHSCNSSYQRTQTRKSEKHKGQNDGYVIIKEIVSDAAQCKKVGGKKEMLRLT